MTDLTTRAVLRHNFMFRGVSDTTLDGLCELANRRSVARDTLIFSQGDDGDALYGVASGRVRIFTSDASGSEVILNLLGPGETFGEIAVIDGQPRTASALAALDSTLVVIPRERFEEFVGRDPELALHLLRLMCERLRWVSNLVEDSLFLGGPERLAKRLSYLAEIYGHAERHEPIELKISQSELGHFLGISRQLINKYLNEWSDQGLVGLRRNHVTILDREALDNIAHTSTS